MTVCAIFQICCSVLLIGFKLFCETHGTVYLHMQCFFLKLMIMPYVQACGEQLSGSTPPRSPLPTPPVLRGPGKSWINYTPAPVDDHSSQDPARPLPRMQWCICRKENTVAPPSHTYQAAGPWTRGIDNTDR